jgi:hypothetical protein
MAKSTCVWSIVISVAIVNGLIVIRILIVVVVLVNSGVVVDILANVLIGVPMSSEEFNI